MILLFYERLVRQYKQSWSAGLQTVPRAGGYFYSVPNNDLLSFSYDGSHFASSLEISVEDKIKRGKPPRIHLAIFLRAHLVDRLLSHFSIVYMVFHFFEPFPLVVIRPSVACSWNGCTFLVETFLSFLSPPFWRRKRARSLSFARHHQSASIACQLRMCALMSRDFLPR